MNIKSREPMAVRRADVRAAVAEANRRARSRWSRLMTACYAVAVLGSCAALWATLAAHATLAGVAFGGAVLAILAADVASGMGAG